jgi:hypothetical protein
MECIICLSEIGKKNGKIHTVSLQEFFTLKMTFIKFLINNKHRIDFSVSSITLFETVFDLEIHKGVYSCLQIKWQLAEDEVI